MSTRHGEFTIVTTKACFAFVNVTTRHGLTNVLYGTYHQRNITRSVPIVKVSICYPETNDNEKDSHDNSYQ